MPRPDNGLPEDIREHMRLMCDIVALGFQTDKTRVATLLLCRDISGLFYPFLDVRTAHHPASHDDQSDAYERVTRYYVSQLAYLAARLDAMPEGEGTVLDNSCLLFISNMWSGSQHDSSKLPVLLAGGLGGTLADRPRPRLHRTRATTTASSAACTSRSWTAWASSSTASATPTPASPASERTVATLHDRLIGLEHHDELGEGLARGRVLARGNPGADEPREIPLWPGGAPGFEARRDEPTVAKDYWVRNIHNPSITAYLPPKEKATGAAVVICPGGGHRELVFNAEGAEPARYLNSIGVAAFALKYRLGREQGSPY